MEFMIYKLLQSVLHQFSLTAVRGRSHYPHLKSEEMEA